MAPFGSPLMVRITGMHDVLSGGLIRSENFEPAEAYPELPELAANWRTIRDEALLSIAAMMTITDSRAEAGEWKILPLMVQDEDRCVVSDESCAAFRRFAPQTVKLAAGIPALRAYAFSLVEPYGRIKAHRHRNPFVSASLCLQGGGHSEIVVDGDRREFHDGEIVIFDYRRLHEVVNHGDKPRIALIVALEKMVR